MKKHRNFAVIFALLCAATTAFADADKGGNGGDAVIIGGIPYLLDFAEIGIETRPYFSPVAEPDVEGLKTIAAVLPESPEVHFLFARKLAEVRRKSLGAYKLMLAAAKKLEIVFVNVDLVDVNDSRTNLKLDPTTLRQIAVRLATRVQINRALWTAMDPENRVGLLFHEILFALQKPETTATISLRFRSCSDFRFGSGSSKFSFLLSSDRTHVFVQDLFRPAFEQASPEAIGTFFDEHFASIPSREIVHAKNPDRLIIELVYSITEVSLKDVSTSFLQCPAEIADRKIRWPAARGATSFRFQWK